MVADTQNFTRGLISSRSEVALMKKLMNDTSPEQKTAKALQMLDRLYDAGKISQTQYKDATAKVRAELEALKRSSKNTGDGMEKLNGKLKGFVAAFISFQAASRGVQLFNDTMKKLDDQGDNAERFGLFVDDFIKMQYALERGGDLERGGAAAALKTMRDNIQLASIDMGRFKQLFGELGADQDIIAAIAFQPINKQLETMVTLIGQMPDAGKRGLITSKLFGTDEGQMASLINGGAAGLQELYRQAEEFNLLQGNEADRIESAAESWKDVSYRWEAVVNKLVVELLPVAEQLADIAVAILGRRPETARLASGSNNNGLAIVRQAEMMSSITQEGMVRFRDNRGQTTRRVTGNLDFDQLVGFLQQARQLDPNFAEASMSADQLQRLRRSALPGDPGGNQATVQLAILEELKRQTQASTELVRQQEENRSQTRNVAGLVE
jgi:hypothetical protein